jgi:hypothetical protein
MLSGAQVRILPLSEFKFFLQIDILPCGEGEARNSFLRVGS